MHGLVQGVTAQTIKYSSFTLNSGSSFSNAHANLHFTQMLIPSLNHVITNGSRFQKYGKRIHKNVIYEIQLRVTLIVEDNNCSIILLSINKFVKFVSI